MGLVSTACRKSETREGSPFHRLATKARHADPRSRAAQLSRATDRVRAVNSSTQSPSAAQAPQSCVVGHSESAGINRHVVGDERALQERKQRIHPGLESCR
jgi:hypothetical protein